MIEMTIDEWGKLIFEGTFKVLRINYNQGETIVYDMLRKVTYSVTYDGEKKKLILEELDDK